MTLRQLLSLPLAAFLAALRLAAPAIRLFVRLSTRNAPSHFGFRFATTIPDDSNRVSAEARILAALSLLTEKAPRHLTWLREQITVIFISHVRGRGPIQLVLEAGILRFHPLMVWKLSDEEIALELAAAATRCRLYRAHIRERSATMTRIARLATEERLWLAQRLSMEESLLAQWRSRLATFATDKHNRPHSRSADA